MSISVLCIGNQDLVKALEGTGILKIRSVEDPIEALKEKKRYDMVVFDPVTSDGGFKESALQMLSSFDAGRLTFRPGLFCAMERGLCEEDEYEILAAGFDGFLFKPFSPNVFLLVAERCAQRVILGQKYFREKERLDKSMGYLERFKSELAQVKSELVEEKNSLNAALRQIQKMTSERRRLKNSASALKESLTRNMEGFGQILSALIRARVEINRGHGEQVAEIAGYLGRELGLDENQLDDLGKAAMLHEVGLLFQSERALTDREKRSFSGFDQTLMIQYPVRGADLLCHCPGFEKAAAIIRGMNEWSDGTGYPDGLKRRYIPIGSRILAGADELENLRAAPDVTDPETLLERLEYKAGERLDPRIVGLLGKYVVTRMSPESFKVRGVGIEQLEPGMTLGMALFTATGTKLFSANTVLTQDAINKILQYSREYPVDDIVYIKV